MEVRLQLLTHLNLQAQLLGTQQGQHQRQHDSTDPQFEKLPCCAARAGDRDSAVLQDALAHDCFASSSDLERIFPPIDCPTRPVDVRRAQSLISRDPLHNALHRLFLFAVSALHFHAEAQAGRKATSVAAISTDSQTKRALCCYRRNPRSTPIRCCCKPLLVDHSSARL